MSKKKFKKKGIERAIRKIFERQPDQKYTAKEISAILQITDKNMRKLVLSILKDLKNDKFLNEFQNGYFIINENYSTTFIGTVDSTARGAAYIMVPELNGDIYVQPENLANALHGDTVEVEIIRQKKNKTEGAITKIIKDRKSTRLNSSHVRISYAVFCLK